MGRIKGHYEWDDDNLTPGRKKEGGLHQNLFNADGKLKGSARFVPDNRDDGPIVVTETVFVSLEDRRTQEQLAEVAAELLMFAIDRGVPKLMPYVEQWWRESARPALASGRAKVAGAREKRRTRTMARARVVAAAGSAQTDPEQVVDKRLPDERPAMSSAEAQARYLAAIAARAFSEEQMRLVAGANIVGRHNVADVKRSLAEHPAEQIVGLVEAMAANPSLLGEETLAQLASILGPGADRRLQVGRSEEPAMVPVHSPGPGRGRSLSGER